MSMLAAMTTPLRIGILLGVSFAGVSLVVFWRAFVSFVEGRPTVIAFGPFFMRFMLGIGVGVGSSHLEFLQCGWQFDIHTRKSKMRSAGTRLFGQESKPHAYNGGKHA